jgi:hypothetical protein
MLGYPSNSHQSCRYSGRSERSLIQEITGLTPSHFKQLRDKRRSILEDM